MDRYDIILGKSKPVKKDRINSDKKPNIKQSKIINTLNHVQNGFRELMGQTEVESSSEYTGTQGLTGTYFLGDELIVNLDPSISPLYHSQEGVINTLGPTSRHLLIAGPDGYRLLIYLRSLVYRWHSAYWHDT